MGQQELLKSLEPWIEGRFGVPVSDLGVDPVPVFAARALPYGTVTATAFTEILERMFAELERAGQLDGILVAPHGATVSQTHPDADGQWLSELRTRIGPNTPIIGTLDLHANLSRLMVDSTDALIAYRSNPHLDQRARGLEAASLMSRTLSGELQPTQAASFPPIAINIERQRTSEPPCASHCQLADEMLRRSGVLSNSILLGFPYADVEEMGTSVLVVSDDDPSLAAECATELAARLWSDREKSVGQMVGIEEALDQAQQLGRELTWLYDSLGARVVVVTGGTSIMGERRELSGSPTVVVGTPGRLRDHLEKDAIALDAFLKSDAGACCELKGNVQDDPAILGAGVGVGLRKGDTELKDKVNAAMEAFLGRTG